MTIRDEEHDIARAIKDLEERVADIERSGGGQTTPNLLRSADDRVAVGDSLNSVVVTDLVTGQYDNTGYDTSTYE